MEVRGHGVETTFTDRLGEFANRWWPIAVILFGAIGFLGVLPHQYTYHW